MESVASRLIAVTGMHRSGTSALAGELARLGATFHSSLLTPDEANPLGYFESKDVMAINDAMMQFLFGGWDSTVTATDLDLQDIVRDNYLRDLLEKFEDTLPPASENVLFCLKDPRLSRLLPLYNPLFAERFGSVTYLLALRNPEEVRASLWRRNFIGKGHALTLWLLYTWEPIRFCARNDVDMRPVDYGMALDDPSIIATIAGLKPVNKAEPSFINPTLHRNVIPDDESVEEGLQSLCHKIYDALRQQTDCRTFAKSAAFEPLDAEIAEIEKSLRTTTLQREVLGIAGIEQRRARATLLLRNTEREWQLWDRCYAAESKSAETEEQNRKLLDRARDAEERCHAAESKSAEMQAENRILKKQVSLEQKKA